MQETASELQGSIDELEADKAAAQEVAKQLQSDLEGLRADAAKQAEAAGRSKLTLQNKLHELQHRLADDRAAVRPCTRLWLLSSRAPVLRAGVSLVVHCGVQSTSYAPAAHANVL